MNQHLKPPGRTGHVAVFYKDYLFVWGGYQEKPGRIANTYFNGEEIWVYSCVSENWYLKKSTSAHSPPGMSGCTAVVIDNAMYLFGGYGYNGHTSTNNLYKLDMITLSWRHLKPNGPSPMPVDKMVGWPYDGKFYIFGGFGNPENQDDNFQFVFYHPLWRGWTNQFFVYDPKENSWSRPIVKGKLPKARAAHAATVLNNKVYIFGGRHDRFRLNDLHCLDMETMQWSGEISTQGPTPQGRSWHSLTALSERYLILYGGFSQDNLVLSDCWRYDTETNNWLKLELPFHKPHLWHCACLNGFNEVLIHGGCTTNILDLDSLPEQTSDIIVIRTTPPTLYRLCIENLMKFRMLQPFWSCLPRDIQHHLCLRAGHLTTSNLDGS